MEKYYYLILDITSFAIPFLFSFEKKWIHFIRFWKPYFLSIIVVGLFFIIWDIYFAYQEIWGFNNTYLMGIRFLKLPIEEWLFFLLIPYASNFIHYSMCYFFPYIKLTKKATQNISVSLFIISVLLLFFNLEKKYTASSLGLFALIMFLQSIYQWCYACQFYISFVIIYIPFFLVNSALTGMFTSQAVVYYNNTENLNIQIGTMPLEDNFYCFTMLYSSILLFEYLREKWNYTTQLSYKNLKR
ncbi:MULTISPECIES: lycopene cyclase domain-containing protein [Flavobacterium]|uniref:Lycopene cyclase domain-containing protein n=1 Tax=Flavobacterium columnare TaxID=996 RepID=A0AA94F2X3_9FLAO|nr:lycopene cyclase domain-containing protein [Flavobacterium columnare]MCH4830386.1 lycopene cyclase domain-containing protein [Flavobacterium columnare]MCH4833677.1 lycopene cyclase domain-containing protein [Flavobacterium columnare]